MAGVTGERPNQAYEELRHLRWKLEGLRDLVHTAFDRVRVPLDVAWQGDTPERVEFVGRLEMYRRNYYSTYDAAMDALTEAIRQEPQTLPTEVWQDDPPPKPDTW